MGPLRFRLYEHPISDVAELHGDGVSSSWALEGDPPRRVRGDFPTDDPAAWRLEAGIVSPWGLGFWIAAAALAVVARATARPRCG